MPPENSGDNNKQTMKALLCWLQSICMRWSCLTILLISSKSSYWGFVVDDSRQHGAILMYIINWLYNWWQGSSQVCPQARALALQYTQLVYQHGEWSNMGKWSLVKTPTWEIAQYKDCLSRYWNSSIDSRTSIISKHKLIHQYHYSCNLREEDAFQNNSRCWITKMGIILMKYLSLAALDISFNNFWCN